MLRLNEVEHKYLELKLELIQITDFEKWVYENELVIQELYTESDFEDLIILNYRDKHAKSNLTKILSIDFEKLEQYQLQTVLTNLIRSEQLEIHEVRYFKYESVYDPYFRTTFHFESNNVKIGIANPFDLDKSFHTKSEEDGCREFKKRFKFPNKFYEFLLDKLISRTLNVVVPENMENVDPNDYVEAISGQENDVIIYIDKHRIIINRNLLILGMKEFWL